LIDEHTSFDSCLKNHVFNQCHTKIINNWNAIHECEDERDADRLKKKDEESKESRLMTAAISLDIPEIDGDDDRHTSGSMKDFHNQQFLYILQQSKWLHQEKTNLAIDRRLGT
jgi:hypothetical protein